MENYKISVIVTVYNIKLSLFYAKLNNLKDILNNKERIPLHPLMSYHALPKKYLQQQLFPFFFYDTPKNSLPVS